MSRRRRKSRRGLGFPDDVHVVKAWQALQRVYQTKGCAAGMHWIGRAEAHIESIMNRTVREKFEKEAADLFERGRRACGGRRG